MYHRALFIRDLHQLNSAMDSLEIFPSLCDKNTYPGNIIQLIIELHKDGIEIPVNLLNWIKQKWFSSSMPVVHSEYLRGAYRKFFSLASYCRNGKDVFKLIHSSEVAHYDYIYSPIILSFKDIKIIGSDYIKQKTAVACIRGFNQLLFREAIVTGGSSLVLLRGKTIYCEHFETSMSGKVKFNHDPILISFNNPWVTVKKVKAFKRLDSAINLVGIAHSHFAHFFFNVLPKLFAANHKDVEKLVPVLIDFDLPEKLINMIHQLGYINTMKIGFGESVRVQKLYQGVNFSLLPDLKGSTVIDNITNTLDPRLFKNYLSIFPRDTASPKNRIYIPRSNSVWGKILQEDEIIDAMKNLGFQIVYPENLSPQLQAKVFEETRTIVTAPSSALANLVYSKPGTKVHIIADSQLFQYSGWLGPFETLGIQFYWHNILKPTDNSRHPNFMFSKN
jgi:hypothetical protein